MHSVRVRPWPGYARRCSPVAGFGGALPDPPLSGRGPRTGRAVGCGRRRNMTSCTTWPFSRPCRSNFVTGRKSGRGAQPSALVLASSGSAPRTSSICSAYGSQSVAQCTSAPGASRETASRTNAGWIIRRLWCRAFGHGSGKNTRRPASDAGGSMSRSSTTASPLPARSRCPGPRTRPGAGGGPGRGCARRPRESRCPGPRRPSRRSRPPCRTRSPAPPAARDPRTAPPGPAPHRPDRPPTTPTGAGSPPPATP